MKNINVLSFGEKMPDGRLTQSSNGTVYKLREAVCERHRLGRSLTEKEIKKFIASSSQM